MRDIAAIASILARGPLPNEVPSHFRVEVVMVGGVTQILNLPDTVIEYYPGPEKPTHVIFWNQYLLMIFDYHTVNYILSESKFSKNKV